MKRVATLVACLLAASCAKSNPYKCTATDQCVLKGAQGTCAPEGFCAFPDPACPSGTRFEANAGDGLGGQCTAPPDAPGAACGELGLACCTGEQGSAGPCVAGLYCNAGMCDECVSDIGFGHDIGCYLKKDHTVWCSGNENAGALGNGMGSNVFVTTATQVVDNAGPITDATALGVGYQFGCVVRTGGAVSCWGRNFNGQLGNNTTTDSNKAVAVEKAMGSGTAPLTDIAEVKAGASETCARDTTGIVYCWGYNGNGALGDGTTTTRHVAAPVLAAAGSASFTGAETLVAGDDHFCAKKAGAFWCWGNGGSYQFGNGSNGDQLDPFQVATAADLAAGNYHNCWVNADTTVSCTGANWHAQMGQGSGNDFTGDNQMTPAQVLSETGGLFMGAVEVAAGGSMSCARTTDGHLWCWGDNKYGQVGNGSPTAYPALVLDQETGQPLEHVDHVLAKYAHICAHTTNAGWKCWGRGGAGELGDGKQRTRGMATALGVSCP